MKYFFVLSCFLTLNFLSMPYAQGQNVIYVNQQATGLQTGDSWENAVVDLQDALDAAFAGMEIWVAKGTYKPTDGTDRTRSFVLKSGVKLLGGFKGTETLSDERNVAANPVILSGEIGDPLTRADNSYHVVRGTGLDAATLVDAFVVTGGYSYGPYNSNSSDDVGAGLLLEGAPWIPLSSPVISNCTFLNNSANYGGAIGIYGQRIGNNQFLVLNPTIKNCFFDHNTAQSQGGALFKTGSTQMDTFKLMDCTFSGNRAVSGGGGGVSIDEAPYSVVSIKRCTFEKDTSFIGGGLYISASRVPNTPLSVHIDSCVFNLNRSLDGGGFCYDNYFRFIDSLQLNLSITNTLFESNYSTGGDCGAFLVLSSTKSEVIADISNCTFLNNRSSGFYTTWFLFYDGCKGTVKYNNNVFYNNLSRNSNTISCFPIFINVTGNPASKTISTKITNCVFEKNGGGIIVLANVNCFIDTEIANCTFYDNLYPQFVRNTWDTIVGEGTYFNYSIHNSIIWEPRSNIWNMFYTNEPQDINISGFQINHSCISLPGPGGPPGSLEAFGDDMLYGVDPMFADSASGDFHLRPCSPLVNAGLNDIVDDLLLDTDIDGAPRIQFDTVDLGAYESITRCSSISTNESFAPQKMNSLSIWNNPSADGYLAFENPVQTNAQAQLKVYDVCGVELCNKPIHLQPNNKVLLTGLPNGIYAVVLVVDHIAWYGKLVLMQ